VSTSASSAELLDAVPALQWMRPLWRVLSADSISSRNLAQSFCVYEFGYGAVVQPLIFAAFPFLIAVVSPLSAQPFSVYPASLGAP
jgi:hypothetical protein